MSITHSDCTQSLLRIRDIQLSNIGIYGCSIESINGTIESSAELLVLGKIL